MKIAAGGDFRPGRRPRPRQEPGRSGRHGERHRYGNASTIYTSSGGAAREYRYGVNCGNIGVNVGIVAPMAFFPFGGRKESFFGDLHGQGKDVIQFFTDRKVVIERWL